jgi:hypothetical protein
MTLLHRIVNRSLDVLFLPGFDRFWRHRLMGKVLCLLYHRVADPGQVPFLDRYGVPPIPPGQLLDELSFLKSQGATFLTFSDLRRGRFPGPEEFGVIVCFDDCFRDNYANFVILAESRVFEQKGAAITLHFDTNGVIRSVTRADMLYKFGVDFKNTN